jgi:hypothetical protein
VGSMTGKKALALGVALAAVAGCHGGNGNRSNALTTSERKYCTLVKEFKDHLPARSADPEPQQFTAAMTQALQKNAGYFDDLQKVAPAEIKPDVEKAIATLRQVATGDISAYDGLNLAKADQWEEDHCSRS